MTIILNFYIAEIKVIYTVIVKIL